METDIMNEELMVMSVKPSIETLKSDLINAESMSIPHIIENAIACGLKYDDRVDIAHRFDDNYVIFYNLHRYLCGNFEPQIVCECAWDYFIIDTHIKFAEIGSDLISAFNALNMGASNLHSVHVEISPSRVNTIISQVKAKKTQSIIISPNFKYDLNLTLESDKVHRAFNMRHADDSLAKIEAPNNYLHGLHNNILKAAVESIVCAGIKDGENGSNVPKYRESEFIPFCKYISNYIHKLLEIGNISVPRECNKNNK